jgi:23S rRNA pseudouridine2604 synthase
MCNVWSKYVTQPPVLKAPPPAPVGQRLAKRVAELLPCSRSEAEQYIEGGWVSVDGQVVVEPQFRVLPNHAVVVAPDANLMELTPVTLLLHKPPGYEDSTDLLAFTRAGKRPPLVAQRLLTTDHHWDQDTASQRVLKRHFVKLAVPVPLETAASGLLVFTQDWRVARKLTEDASVLEHEIMAEVTGTPTAQQLTLLNQGLGSDGDPLPRVKVSLSSSQGNSAKLRFAFKGAHPGLVDHLCRRMGWQLTGMRRMRVGRVALAHLPEGRWRYLAAHERF